MPNGDPCWFAPFIQELDSKNTDVVFIVDKIGLSKFEELKSLLKEKCNALNAQSEIRIRRIIRKRDNTNIIVKDETSIPYDLESHNSVIRLDYSHSFPRLNPEAVREFMEDKGETELIVIYEEYKKEFSDVYDDFNKQKTEEFLNEALSDENYLRAELKSIKRKFESKKKSNLNEDQLNQLSSLIGQFDYIKNRNNLYGEALDSGRDSLDEEIARFIRRDYEDLLYKSKTPLNHKIIDTRLQKNSKNALICIDGMGYEEWNIIKEHLQKDFSLNEEFSVSMLPPITRYSRLSIFSGKTPGELMENDDLKFAKEEKLFEEKISEKTDTPKEDIGYFKKKTPSNLDNYLHYDQVGFVFTFVDKISHNASDEEILVKSIENELGRSNIKEFLEKLLENDFNVVICSDHGGLFAEGVGKFINKELVEDGAKRALVYRSKDLANESESEHTEIFDNLSHTLGDKTLTMFKSNKMLDNEGKREHTHGGISLKEIFLPLIEVDQN